MATVATTRAADAHVHRLYGAYAGMPAGVVTQCVQHAAALQQLIWGALDGDRAAKARVFFERHEEAVFALMQRTASRTQRRAEHQRSGLTAVLDDAGDDVLDFGGGLGFSASLLHDAGKKVTYVDVAGPVTAFAQWYFAHGEQPDIEVCTTPCARVALPAGRQWDLVLAEHVLEWLPDPVAAIERLAAAVRPGGTLFLELAGGDGAGDGMACHVDVEALLAGAPSLRAMQHVRDGDDGRHMFRQN